MSKSVAVSYPTDRAVTVEREFAAPVDLVFACHTKPQLLQRWMLGPPGWSMPVCEIATTVGGTYRYIWRNDADGAEFGFTGVFKEVVVPTRIVHTESMIGAPGEALVTTIFTAHGNRTTLSLTMSFDTPALRDEVLATGMTDGMAMSYDRMDEVLAEAVV